MPVANLLLALIALPAHTDAPPVAAPVEIPSPAFKKGRLFVNQPIEQDAGRTFAFGINFTIAPVRAVAQKALQDFEASYEGAEAVLEAAQYVDPETIRNLNVDEARAQLKAVEELTAEERDQIDTAFDAVGDDTDLIADLVEIMQSGESAITFSLEPFMEVDLEYVDMRFVVPLAGFTLGGETDFAMGNIGLDAHAGWSIGENLAFAVTGGLEYWIPSATSRSNAVALANMVAAPRFFHEYTSVVPYLVLAGDLRYVQLQVSLAYDMMFAVKGDPAFDQIQFLHWGTSLSVTAIPYVVLSAEVTGLVATVDADAVDSIFTTFGLRFVADWMDLGLAFQLPVVDKEASDVSGASGVSFGSPGKYNAFITALFGF